MLGAMVAAGLASTGRNAVAAPDILPQQRAKRLNKGFNLPGWADRLPEDDGRSAAGELSTALLATLRHLGFSSVRLPLDPVRITGVRADEVLTRIEQVSRLLNELGYSVIWDMHAEDDLVSRFEKDRVKAEQIVMAAWKKLAPVLNTLPAGLNFGELLNEPPMEKDHWLHLRGRLVTQIRKHCPHHTLVWGAARYQGIWETLEQPVPEDKNMIAAVHYYTPIGFTHQCADWSGEELKVLRNLPFPAKSTHRKVVRLRQHLKRTGNRDALAFLRQEFEEDWTYQRIEDDFGKLARWSKAHGQGVLLNEFGVLNFCVDPVSRANWVRQVCRSAHKFGIPWMYWEFDRGFGFVSDRKNWKSLDYAMLEALLA